ncbi:uncharacterized protein LOC135214059 [Macrobrachium nipponense]|uniref:uncharacterized protein LOC135214059 n=1 Tax=Macrobrachium nipponense TaxID=159736 RepID=UPI0030C8B09F
MFVGLKKYQEEVIFLSLLNGPLSPTDPRLISYLRSNVLIGQGSGNYNLKMFDATNPANVGYNQYLTHPVGFPPLQRILKDLFDDRPPGFFVEAGALDGEYLSNTLYLERAKGWEGILVEPDGKMFAHLLRKNRRAMAANCCLSTRPYPVLETLVTLSNDHNIRFEFGFRAMNALYSSPMASRSEGAAHQTFSQVQCFPLLSLLKAAGASHVHFVSLDIEGVEGEVVRTLLDHEGEGGVTVDAWMVEHQNPNTVLRDEMDEEFIQWFVSKGYALHAIARDAPVFNYVFVRKASSLYESFYARRNSTPALGVS